MKFLNISPCVIFYIDLKIKRKKKLETSVSLTQELLQASKENHKLKRTRNKSQQRSFNTEKIARKLVELKFKPREMYKSYLLILSS